MLKEKEKPPGTVSVREQLQLASNKFGLPSSQVPRIVYPEWLMRHRDKHPNPYEFFNACEAKLFINAGVAPSEIFCREPTLPVDTNTLGGDNGLAPCRSSQEACRIEDYMQSQISLDNIEKKNDDTTHLSYHEHEGSAAKASNTRLVHQFTPITEANDPGREENDSFAFSPGQLNKMLNPKCLNAFYALGGMKGLEQGLKTNLLTGLDYEQENNMGSEDDVGQGKKDPGNKRKKTRRLDMRKRVFGENRLWPSRKKRLVWVMRNDKMLVVRAILLFVYLVLLAHGLHRMIFMDGSRTREAIANALLAMGAFLIASNEGIIGHLLEKQNCQEVEQKVKVLRSGLAQLMPADEILAGDVLYLDPGDHIPVDGIFIDGYNVKCDESSATGEPEIVKKTPGKDVVHSAEEKPDPFILSGSRVVEGFGTVVVTAVGEHANIGRIIMSIRDEEINFLKIGGLSLATSLMWLFNSFIKVCPCLALALSLNAGRCLVSRVQIGVGYSFPDLLFIPCFCCTFLYVEDLLVRAISGVNEMEPSVSSPDGFSHVGQTDGRDPKASGVHETLLSFKICRDAFSFRAFAPQPQNEPILQDPRSLLRHGTSSTSTCLSLANSHRTRSSMNWKRLLGFFLAVHSVPLAAASFTVARSARIASGITSAISGVTVIPLRTADDFPAWSWALTYGVWAATFSVYLWLQTQRIPPEVKSRRELYLFCVIMAAVHFTIAISQALTSILDAITLYGPILLTASAYLMSLLQRALNPRISHANPILDGSAGFSGSEGNTGNAETSSGAQRNETTIALALAAIGGGASV